MIEILYWNIEEVILRIALTTMHPSDQEEAHDYQG
jgi:hypothetical protein